MSTVKAGEGRGSSGSREKVGGPAMTSSPPTESAHEAPGGLAPRGTVIEMVTKPDEFAAGGSSPPRAKVSRRRHRGPSRRLDPAMLAVAVDVDLHGLAILYGLSTSTLLGYVRDKGLPHYRHAGKIIVNRAAFERWRERFRSGAADSLVAEVLADVVTDKPLADASRRLRSLK
jgi:hypothetical protein